jgi:DNA-binding protein
MITLSEAIKEFAKQTYDTVKVKGGKNYIQVKDRLNFVRETFGERVSIRTTTKDANGLAEFHCEMWLDDKLIATGNSKEVSVGEKSYEKQESVAVGRCLAFAGFAGTELASADEMQNFLNNQTKPVAKPNPNAKAVADEFLKYLSEAAKYSRSVGSYENQKQKFMKEFKIVDLKDSDPAVFDYVVKEAQAINEQVTTNINANK